MFDNKTSTSALKTEGHKSLSRRLLEGFKGDRGRELENNFPSELEILGDIIACDWRGSCC